MSFCCAWLYYCSTVGATFFSFSIQKWLLLLVMTNLWSCSYLVIDYSKPVSKIVSVFSGEETDANVFNTIFL